jgi:hypothetical protein
VTNHCANCGIGLRGSGIYCDVCQSIADAVNRPFFRKAQREFLADNLRRIRTKERLLNSGEEAELR